MKKKMPIFLILVSALVCAQTSATRIYGSFNGFWTSSTPTPTVVPNDSNLLLGFSVVNSGVTTTYSTGVNDAVLANNSVVFSPQNFSSIPSPKPTTNDNSFIGIGRNWGGNVQGVTGEVPSNPQPLSYYLTDGSKGLELSTAIFNIVSNTAMRYEITPLNPITVTDDVPDLVIPQMGMPSSTLNKFRFINAAGATVGNEIQMDFSTIPSIGRQQWTFYDTLDYTYEPGVSTSQNGNRDLRLLTFKLTDFGINATNYAQIRGFVVTFSGTSDQPFLAYNNDAFRIICYEPATTTGTNLPTKHGITMLKRAGEDNDGNPANNWPMNRTGAWTALESNTKGMVINRLNTTQILAITNPQEGMVVYDTIERCLKIYSDNAWNCFNKATCPNN